MVKMKFYGKKHNFATRFVNANKSITFVFCRTDQKKKSFYKAIYCIKLYEIFDFLIITTSFNTF